LKPSIMWNELHIRGLPGGTFQWWRLEPRFG
jgi:hypothetical protein